MSDELSDEELYAKFGDRLVRLATTIVGPADAEDVMIEGVLSAMGSRQWSSVDDPAGARGCGSAGRDIRLRVGCGIRAACPAR